MKNFFAVLSFILIIGCIGFTYYSSMPRQISDLNTPSNEFSTLRALEHVKNISKQPHFIGSIAHEQTKIYITEELKKLGLTPQIQEGFSITGRGSLSKPKNIIAKIKGSSKGGKALLLLSHYDSSPHSSYGASDAGSGVATILEGIRAYLAQKKTPKNDIIICITDGEELGLHGANLFVTEHKWAKDVGLALNFEARGSGGNSYMLMETTSKNGKMIEEFVKADPQFPVTNSLAYSVYKLLPNDTDLTIFREKGNINGFNFAFIDDHFDYHTANDTWQNLDLNTLQHQGSYLMPLVTYFSDSDLSNLTSEEDYIYFNLPYFRVIKFPFLWRFPLVGAAALFLIILIIFGVRRSRIKSGDIATGFLAFLISLGISGGFGFGLWKVSTIIYPQFNDILQGFPYNGYFYIAASIFLAIAAFFKVYSIFDDADELPGIMIAPLLFWIVICGAATIYLPGATYLIIPVLLCLICLFILIIFKRPFSLLMAILCLPSIVIIMPFIASFPVALGLKIVFVSSALTVLLCALLLPVIGLYSKKSLLGTIAFAGVLICLGVSHIYASFNEERPKPNSLVYLMHEDDNKAYWASYDHELDPWTKKHIDRLHNLAKNWEDETMGSKYSSNFNYISEAPLKEIKSSNIEASLDTIQGDIRTLDISIQPQRSINRMDIFMDASINFKKLSVNGKAPKDITDKNGNNSNIFTKRLDAHLLTYFISKNEPLEMKMKFHKDSTPKIVVYESSYDLLENNLFEVEKRTADMIPKPFVINDAITTKKTIDLKTVRVKKVIDSILPTTETELISTK